MPLVSDKFDLKLILMKRQATHFNPMRRGLTLVLGKNFNENKSKEEKPNITEERKHESFLPEIVQDLT